MPSPIRGGCVYDASRTVFSDIEVEVYSSYLFSHIREVLDPDSIIQHQIIDEAALYFNPSSFTGAMPNYLLNRREPAMQEALCNLAVKKKIMSFY